MVRIFETEWVEIDTTNNESEAYLVKGLLEGEGLPCQLRFMRVPLIPVTMGGLGEIRVCVLPEDVAEARRMLSTYRIRSI